MGYALSDGTNVVSFMPGYDLKMDGRKIENSHRTTNGSNYRFVWGAYKHVKFKVDALSSADMCRINSWWFANVPVVLYDLNSAAVCSGFLSNASVPIDQYMKPYYDQFMGTIELEGF